MIYPESRSLQLASIHISAISNSGKFPLLGGEKPPSMDRECNEGVENHHGQGGA
jgi:hypothetical protein